MAAVAAIFSTVGCHQMQQWRPLVATVAAIFGTLGCHQMQQWRPLLEWVAARTPKLVNGPQWCGYFLLGLQQTKRSDAGWRNFIFDRGALA